MLNSGCDFNQDELAIIRDAVYRQIPGKAAHLTNVANEIRSMNDRGEKDELIEKMLGKFIAIHEEIGLMLGVYARAKAFSGGSRSDG